MKKTLFLAVLFSLGVVFYAHAQTSTPPPTLRSILLEQFRTTWNQQDWFVPAIKSLEGVTATQAMWKPSDSSHSIGQLAYHLYFWNQEELDKFNGRKPAAIPGDNNETFTAFTPESWASTIRKLDEVMKEWEAAIKNADEAKLQSWYSVIAHISTHNAYHTGQILYIRKLAGNWNPEKGVK